MKKAIIVAKYLEDISWLDKYKDLNLYIYDKSPEPSIHPKLNNVGRESNTYLHHIVLHYDDLSDINIFTQGNPFDHVSPNFIDTIACSSYTPLGTVRPHDGDPGSISRDASIWPAAVSIEVCQKICKIADVEYQDVVTYPAGACFAVTKDSIRKHPKHIYEKLLEMSITEPKFPWNFERLTKRIFDNV